MTSDVHAGWGMLQIVECFTSLHASVQSVPTVMRWELCYCLGGVREV